MFNIVWLGKKENLLSSCSRPK